MTAHSSQSEAVGEGLSVQTRERILDAAERLFAEKGLEGVSTREITTAAEANVGAINYYFGGKQGLVLAVFHRRLTPLNQKRMEALEGVEKAAGEGAPKLEAILEALIRPLVEDAFDIRPGHAHFARLVGRIIGEVGETVDELRHTHFLPLARRFEVALHRALPTMSQEELFWRMISMFGALHFMMLATHQPLPEWHQFPSDAETQIQRMIEFAAAGLRAGQLLS
ncbi:MAG TPA: TetR family transcriptional regulator [Candidatus Sulfotelmatobacter sp.]|nr:TetR family transcriptional regulator [Candidatus Sulfotelmatobacter sp.]HWI56353.1 TetR family transcriptional regulator [Bacillota bacterium]